MQQVLANKEIITNKKGHKFLWPFLFLNFNALFRDPVNRSHNLCAAIGIDL